jgi:hypothetical protein
MGQPFCFPEIMRPADVRLLAGKYHNTKQNETLSDQAESKGGAKCLKFQLK